MTDRLGLVRGIKVVTKSWQFAPFSPGTGFKDVIPHQWLAWPGGSAGFSPATWPTGPFQKVPGTVAVPEPDAAKTSIKVTKQDAYYNVFKACPDCPATIECLSQFALSEAAVPKTYCLVGSNCQNWVDQALNHCGLTKESRFMQLKGQK